MFAQRLTAKFWNTFSITEIQGTLFEYVGTNCEFCSLATATPDYYNWIYNIQGDSRGNVHIFGGDIKGLCKRKYSYEHVSNSEWLPR